METYSAFGSELLQCATALAQVVEREILQPILRQIEQSDQDWQQHLPQIGWRLSFEPVRVQGVLSSFGFGSSASQAQEVSVFMKTLPRPLCENARAAEMWAKRQQLEGFLLHPNFEPEQRQCVLERLRGWRQQGLIAGMRADFRTSDAMPTDGHILENLLIQMLRNFLDFDGCFVGIGQEPPRNRHQGQAPVAYLRQIANQAIFPKPMPVYEVVTQQRVWRLRPGPGNLLEALAILLRSLRSQPSTYLSFPPMLRTAVEGSASLPIQTSSCSWF